MSPGFQLDLLRPLTSALGIRFPFDYPPLHFFYLSIQNQRAIIRGFRRQLRVYLETTKRRGTLMFVRLGPGQELSCIRTSHLPIDNPARYPLRQCGQWHLSGPLFVFLAWAKRPFRSHPSSNRSEAHWDVARCSIDATDDTPTWDKGRAHRFLSFSSLLSARLRRMVGTTLIAWLTLECPGLIGFSFASIKAFKLTRCCSEMLSVFLNHMYAGCPVSSVDWKFPCAHLMSCVTEKYIWHSL